MVAEYKAIFLDRDGIVNRACITNGKPYPPLKLTDVFLVDGIYQLIKDWHWDGYAVIVVTNQPDIANHIVEAKQVDKINRYLKSWADFDDIFVCPHNDKDNCNCRKPKPGLILEACDKYLIDPAQSYMIGDRAKDIEAGKRAGCKTIFVDYNYKEDKPKNADIIVKSVLDIQKVWREL